MSAATIVVDSDCLTCGGEGWVDSWWGESLAMVCPACALRARGIDPYAVIGSPAARPPSEPTAVSPSPAVVGGPSVDGVEPRRPEGPTSLPVLPESTTGAGVGEAVAAAGDRRFDEAGARSDAPANESRVVELMDALEASVAAAKRASASRAGEAATREGAGADPGVWTSPAPNPGGDA